MRAQHSGNRIIALLLGVAAFAASGCALADPPTRVARVGYLAGNVSFSPAGENDWVQARLNRPLTTGDRLWADRASSVELQVGGAVIRMGESTSLTLLNLDDNVAQVQLDQGTLNVRVRQLGSRQSVEVATPNLAFTTRRAGSYRIEVDPMDDATAIVVRSGQGEVYGERAAYAVDSRQAYRFAGTGLRSYEYIAAPRANEFERWASDRDRRAESSASARYVSRDLIGYEDLDANGTWRNERGYGNVWVPTRVSADWTPYRDGHWAWVHPWGWTWVDDAPWGFAVSHYGRWANFGGRWAWVPGPARSPAVYAPALVAFVGGSNFQLSISSGNVAGVAWFPLGPREVYRPSYPVSRGYFDNVNRSNTTVTNTTITNVYNNRNVTNVYANRQVQGAVVAVPATAFVQSQPVSRAAVRLSRETAASAPISAVAAVAPVQQSVRGGAPPVASPPAGSPARASERRVVVRSAPPAARAGFAAQERELAAKPGTPLAPAASAALKPAAPVPAPNVVVAAPPKSAPPSALPPANAPDGKPSARDRRDERRADTKPAAAPVAPPPATPAQPAAPAAAKPAPLPAQAAPAQAAPAQAAPVSPAGQPQRDEKAAKGERQRDRERGVKGDQAGKGDQPAKPAATPPAPPAAPAQPAPAAQPKPVAVPPQTAPAQAAPAAPAPAKPAPVPPQAAPVQAAPPAAAAQPQRDEKGAKGERQRDREQGGKGDQGTKGDQPAKPAAPPAAPAPAKPAAIPPQAAPVQAAPPAAAKPAPEAAPAKPQPAPVTPKPEPAPVPVKPAPPPPPPPVKPVPAPAPVPTPVPAPPKPEPAPAAKQAPMAPPGAAPQSPPKPTPDAGKQDDGKSDKQKREEAAAKKKREEAAAKKGDEQPAREEEKKK